jgi:hypothetical protein
LEKGKRKGIPALVGRGGFLAQPGAACARAPAQLRPKAGDGAGALGDDAVAAGPHASESAGGGGTAPRADGGANRLSSGEKPGRRWARRRFAAGGPVLGQWVVALAWGGSGEPRGGLNLARGGLGGGCPWGGGGAPRRESPSVSFGRGIGVGD